MDAWNAPFRTLARSTPFAVLARFRCGSGYEGNRFDGDGRFDRLKRHVITKLLETVDQLAGYLRLVVLIVMTRAEFLINATIANNVKDDSDQLMSDSHDGLLFAAASPHATIQRRKMRVLLWLAAQAAWHRTRRR